MKKIIALLVLLTFCSESIVFSAAGETDTKAATSRLKQVQKEEEPINLDAFNNNYQVSVEQSVPKVELSPIEELFNGKESAVSGKVLHQVGYDLFTSNASPSGAVGKYENSYKLNIGEKINIYSYGDSVDVMALSGASLVSPSSSAEVD